MQLDLIDRRGDRPVIQQSLQMVRLVIRHADRASTPGLRDHLERAPRLEETLSVPQRPVNQVQIDVVEAETLQTRIESRQRRVVALIGVPQFGGDEDLVARYGRFPQALAHRRLITVDARGINVPVAGLVDRETHRTLCVLVTGLPHAKTQLRNPDPIVEGDKRHRGRRARARRYLRYFIETQRPARAGARNSTISHI